MAKSSDKLALSEEQNAKREAKRRGAPGVVAPSTRVNVAFPFSQIKLQEPSKELAELAAVMLDLVTSMAEWFPEERLEELRARTQAVCERLR